MNKFETTLAQNLMQINAIKIRLQNPFTWASGIKSPIYCDNRITLSYPEIRHSIKAGLAGLVHEFQSINAISGVATAGIAHGALIADYMSLPFSYVRASAKSHGRQNSIEGDIAHGSNIMVVEDLISTGGSSLEVVQILREAGHKVGGVIAIFDYEFQIAKDNFSKANCSYKSLLTYSKLLDHAVSSGYVTNDEAAVLRVWSSDPEHWYQNHFIQS
ncbi:MAG: orotate phosphoribosyltransferase [Saprospiraceae bacterium]